jgi:hypothetical protein
MSASAVAAQQEAQPKRISSPARLVGVLFSPGKTFADIGREPHFLLALSVALASALISGATIVYRVGTYELARKMVMMSPAARSGAISSDQIQQQTATFSRFAALQFTVAPVLFTAILIFAIAAICLGVANFGMGQELKYKQLVAVVAHAMMPLVVMGIIVVVILFANPDPTSLDLNNPFGTNVGFYLDQQNNSKVLLTFLKSFDVFWLWALALIGLGMSKIGRKISTGAGLTVSFVLWAIYAGFTTAMSAIF